MEPNIDLIGEDLFNKIRSRFDNLTLGNSEGIVTNNPKEARFFDFEYKENAKILGNISINLDENNLSVLYQKDFLEDQDSSTKQHWYGFLKELRTFAKKRLLNFDVRDITKSNLNKRDYQFLSNTSGDNSMTESKLYGTSKTSFQDIGDARLSIKHSQPINAESPAGRTQHIQNIYIENNDGERFKYPLKHLNGARAMARHVSEGGKIHDDFGKHIIELSQELGKLRKFKNYVNRSSVMAEGLSEYSDIVNDRIATVKKTIESIQKQTQYKDILENFTVSELETVPEELAQNWIDQLTIKQFNEELRDVFPYIYKLISEKTKAKELGPDDLIEFTDGDKIKLTPYKKSLPDGFEMVGITNQFGPMFALMDKQEQTLIIPRTLGNDVAMDIYKIRGGKFMHSYSGGVSNAGPLTKKYLTYVHSMNKKKPSATENIDFEQFEKWAEDTVNNALENENKIPVTEFVLSMYDRETGQFPKGETAILTAVEKDYGEQYINPAKQFIEAIHKKYQEVNGYNVDQEGILQDDDVDEKLIDPKSKSDRKYFVVPDIDDYHDIQNDRRFAGDIEVADENSEVMVLPNSRFHKLKMMYGNKVKQVDPQFTQTYEDDVDESGLQYYIGKKKYGKDGMKALAKAGRNGASQEELGKIKDQYMNDSADILRLAGIK